MAESTVATRASLRPSWRPLLGLPTLHYHEAVATVCPKVFSLASFHHHHTPHSQLGLRKLEPSSFFLIASSATLPPQMFVPTNPSSLLRTPPPNSTSPTHSDTQTRSSPNTSESIKHVHLFIHSMHTFLLLGSSRQVSNLPAFLFSPLTCSSYRSARTRPRP